MDLRRLWTLPLMLLLGACETVPFGFNAPAQDVEFQLHPDSAALAPEGLKCFAQNNRGKWDFQAPGRVTVKPSMYFLFIQCVRPDGAIVVTTGINPQGDQIQRIERAGDTGAKVGLGAGTALGAGAASFFAAPALVPLFMLSGYATGDGVGRTLGGLAAANDKNGQPTYPTPVVLKIDARPRMPFAPLQP